MHPVTERHVARVTQIQSQLSLMKPNRLHALQNSLLELTLHLLAGLVGVGLTVEVEEGTEVELWRLQEFDLADVDL